MDATEHTNGTPQGVEPDPSTPHIFKYLDALPETLTEADRLEHYQILRPELAALYESDPVAFDLAAKAVTKKLRVKARALREGIKDMMPPAEEPAADAQAAGSPSQATRLVALAADVELFHTPDGAAWATLVVDSHHEHWPLKAKGFRRWLARRFYKQKKKAPGSQALQDALTVLEGKALFDGAEYPVFTRVAEHNGAVYLDLANDKWEAVEIDSTGWRVVADPPVKFRRAKGMLPLPYPVAGGSVAELRPFVNVPSDTKETLASEWVLLIAWLIAALRPTGPYPLLPLHGEQGSAKSTTARVLRSLVDPNQAPLRAESREGRDLMIAATNGWVLAFDNLSRVAPWLSDALCRLATGGGFATRELYTDAEEMLFSAQRPVLLNGIEELAAKGDLLDRSLPLSLPVIPEEERKQEATFWRAFEEARPRILGALLDVVVAALRNLPTVKLDRLPRMADFAAWTTAAEPALGWKAGTFMTAYAGNREAVNDLALEGSPVAPAVRALVEQLGKEEGWQGTATALLEKLDFLVSEATVKTKLWPKTAKGLSGILRRLAPNLRAVGISVEFWREQGGKRERMMRLSRVEQKGNPASQPSQPSQSPSNEAQSGTHPNTDASRPAADASRPNGGFASDSKGFAHAGTHRDDRDAKNPPRSKPVQWEKDL